MNGKVFSNQTKDNLVKVIDKAVKLGVIGELLDGPMIRGTLNLIDHYGDKVVPDEYDEPINEIAQAIINEEYELAEELAGSLLNKLIDLPVLDENTEEAVFTNGIKFLVTLIINLINKKKQEENV